MIDLIGQYENITRRQKCSHKMSKQVRREDIIMSVLASGFSKISFILYIKQENTLEDNVNYFIII